MGTVKTLLIPALISLAVYLLYTYVIGPFIKRQRQYASYIPLPSASFSPAALRGRLSSALIVLFLPSTWGMLPEQWRTRDNSMLVHQLHDGDDDDTVSEISDISGDEEQVVGLPAGR